MADVSGELLSRRPLSGIRTKAELTWQEALLLLGLGAGAIFLHATFRWPLQLPGHHGLEWMALLVVGRSFSRYRWAASISSLGAAVSSIMPAWGFSDPFIWLVYLLPGLVMDIGYNLGRYWHGKAWFLAGLGGLALATKPLIRILISTVAGWPYGSLLYGLMYPLATHILFGFLGGLVGAGLYLGRHSDTQKVSGR